MIARALRYICVSFLFSQFALAGPIQNEVILLLDGSGSIYDSGFVTWNAMLDTANLIVSQTESSNTAHGVGIVSGGRSIHTVANAAAAGKMNMHWGLHDGAIDPFTGATIDGTQSSGDVTGFLDGLDDSDWPSGFSWHEASFEMALQSFLGSSNTGDTNKFIFFLTDGTSPTAGHELIGPGYESSTYQDLLALGVNIVSILFDNGTVQDTDYFEALVTDPNYLISASDLSFDASTIVPSDVPEPGSLIIMTLGMLGIALRRRQVRLVRG